MHTLMLGSRFSMALLTLGCAFMIGACYSAEAESADGSNEASESIETAQAALTSGWTAWTSEEFSPINCGTGRLISQIQFSGSNSDNIRAYCQVTGAGSSGVAFPLPYFSEEGAGRSECPEGTWISGLSCSGSYCDNVSLQCSPLPGTAGECKLTQWRSEESGGLLTFTDGYYAREAECRGSFCDEMRFLICEYEKPKL